MKAKVCLLLLTALYIAKLSFAEIPINTDAVRKSVVFILLPPDQVGVSEVGTGFLIAVPLKSDPGLSRIFLVTARHVVEPQWACSPRPNPLVAALRFNKKNFNADKDENGIDVEALSLVENGKKTWFSHPDERVDLAVFPIIPKVVQDFDHIAIKYSEVGTPEEIKAAVTVGADIMSAGLVPELVDAKRNYPSFQFGKISFIPDTPTHFPCATQPSRTAYLWYAAANFSPGNSGSPVFYVPEGNSVMGFNNQRPMIIGVVSTTILAKNISGLVPIRYLEEILSQNFPDLDLSRVKQKVPDPQPTVTPKP